MLKESGLDQSGANYFGPKYVTKYNRLDDSEWE